MYLFYIIIKKKHLHLLFSQATSLLNWVGKLDAKMQLLLYLKRFTKGKGKTSLATCLMQLRPLLQLLGEQRGQEQGAGLQSSVEQEALGQYLHYLSSPAPHVQI